MHDHAPGAGRLLQPLWDACLRTFGVDRLGHPLLFVVAVISTVIAAGLVFSVVDAFVTKKVPFRDTALYLAITLPGYLLVYVALEFLPITFRFEVPRAAPTLAEFARDFVVCFVVGDVLSYWWHRLEHGSSFVFRHVHYVHHAVKRPLSVWSGFYVHPIESATVFATFYVYPLVMQVHPMIFFAYAMANTFVTMVTHCGYDLPLYPKSIFASGPMHEHHHDKGAPKNFSVLLNFSDKLFGTFRRFDGEHAAPPPA